MILFKSTPAGNVLGSHWLPNTAVAVVMAVIAINSFAMTTKMAVGRLENPKLGQGFDSKSTRLSQDCILGETLSVPNQKSYINFDTGLSDREKQEYVSGAVSAGVDAFVASAKATITLSKLVETSSTSIRLVYVYDAVTGTQKLNEFRIHPSIIGLIDEGYTDLLKKNCGDSFVSEVTYGGQLILSVNIQFSDEYVKKQFQAKVTFKAFGFKKTKSWSAVDETWHEFAHVSFDGLQIGGDPNRLSKILDQGNKDCNIREISRCHHTIDELLRYATDSNGFVADIRSSPREFKTIGYAENGFSSVSGEVLGNPTFVDIQSKADLAELQGLYLNSVSGIDELLAEGVRPDLRSQVLNLRRNLLKKKNQVESIMRLCSRNVTQCGSNFLALAEDVRNGYRIELQKYRANVFNWCSQNLDVQEVRAILDRLNSSNCLDLDRKSRHLIEIDLSGLNLKGVGFLRYFENLQQINLDENNIVSLYPLNFLEKIDELSVRHNQISNLNHFRDFSRIKWLDLAHNRLTTIRPLLSGAFDFLNVYGNPLTKAEVEKFFPFRPVFMFEDACLNYSRNFSFEHNIPIEIVEQYHKSGLVPYFDQGSLFWVACDVVDEKL